MLRLRILLLAAVLVAAGTASSGTADAQPAPFGLTSLCTSYENFEANLRSFAVTNNTGVATTVSLFNRDIGVTVQYLAPPGRSETQVPARRAGGNTIILTAPDGFSTVKASNNRVCAVVSGNAECDPSVGQTTITWTVQNNDGSPKPITASTQPVTYSPNPIPANGRSIGVQVLQGPASRTDITEIVTVDLGADVISRPSATLTLDVCTGPPLPPTIDFTFTKTASVSTANVGDTISYTYCGTNNSTIPLEVVRLVDDRLGLIFEIPGVATIVQPGDSLCNTDIGEIAEYVVDPLDAGTTIENDAIVSVRDPQVPGTVYQATAEAQVVVPLPPLPPDPEPTPTTTTTPVVAPTTARPATLPATGPSATGTGGVMAAAFVLLGAAALLVARRPGARR